MKEIVKVGIVSYLNAKPLVYGLKNSPYRPSNMELIEDFPSRIAEMLETGEIDLGLVPVAVLPGLRQSYIISDFCIGAEDKVATVALFSEQPIESLHEVILDYQSRTSVRLLKVLMRYHWKKEMKFSSGSAGYEKEIKNSIGGVVIGDRAFGQALKSPYIYDLAEEWKKMTGLPFVFAAWISNRKLDDSFIDGFNKANQWGLDHLEDLLSLIKYDHYDLRKYYTENISFNFDEPKKEALNLFLSYLGKL